MKKQIWALLITMMCCVPASAEVDFGLNLGALYPWDTVTRQTFAQNFYFQGHLGAVNDNGWEVRANLGYFSDQSHHPADIAKNFRLSVAPLTVSVMYHFFGNGAFFQPYVGGGVGAYFYSLRDDLFGDLESGTRFGPHLLGGIKFNINPDVYINTEYSHAFMSKIFFNRANNFNASMFTLGVGFRFPTKTVAAPRQAKPRYTQYEQDMLDQMAQLKTEVTQMQDKRKELVEKIDQFYATANEHAKGFDQQYQKTKFMEDKVKNLEGKLTQAQTKLNSLEKQWELEHREDQVTVKQHVIYYHDHYSYGRPYRRGYARPAPLYYHPHDYSVPVRVSPKSATVEDRKKFVEKKQEYTRDLKNR